MRSEKFRGYVFTSKYEMPASVLDERTSAYKLLFWGRSRARPAIECDRACLRSRFNGVSRNRDQLLAGLVVDVVALGRVLCSPFVLTYAPLNSRSRRPHLARILAAHLPAPIQPPP